MNAVKVFENGQFGKVRTVTMDEETWFVGIDVAEALGYAYAKDAVKTHVDKEDKIVFQKRQITSLENGAAIADNFPNRGLTLINESGLNSLILSSKLPTARKFRRWITGEVIPAIHKHGGYLTPEKVEEALLNPDVLIELATALKEERAKKAALEAKIERDKPMVDFATAVTDSNDTISISELAKLACMENIKIGRQKLFAWLRKKGYIMPTMPVPYQRYIDDGTFIVREGYRGSGISATPIITTRVTGKGQIKLINHLMMEFES